LIFVTVGSMFPFDRLIRSMDLLVASGELKDEVRSQIGSGAYEPRAMPFQRFMDKAEFDALLERAEMIVSHAGIGSIATALRLGKPMLVVPRRGRLGEHVNDHQVATARKYEELGHVLAAYDENDILRMIEGLRRFRPVPRKVNAVGVADRVARFLTEGC
jgi:exopolysaccharide biosynthesis glucuronosyltransferase PssE